MAGKSSNHRREVDGTPPIGPLGGTDFENAESSIIVLVYNSIFSSGFKCSGRQAQYGHNMDGTEY